MAYIKSEVRQCGLLVKTIKGKTYIEMIGSDFTKREVEEISAQILKRNPISPELIAGGKFGYHKFILGGKEVWVKIFLKFIRPMIQIDFELPRKQYSKKDEPIRTDNSSLIPDFSLAILN